MLRRNRYLLKDSRFIIFFSFLLGVFFIFNGFAQSRGFPTEKTLTFVVPTSAGGGMDRYSRLLVIYLKKYLPSHPDIVIKDMPGGDFAIGINAVMNAKPDGYTLGLFLLPGNVLNEVLGVAKYDLSKATWLGSVTSAPQFVVVRSNSPYHSLSDLQNAKKTLNIPIPGFQSVTGSGAVIAAHELGIKSKFIPNRGSTECLMALLRGDGDYLNADYPPMRSQIKEGSVRVLYVYSDKRLRALPNVPTIKELGYNSVPIPLEVANFCVASTPGIPKGAAMILRKAFEKAVKDVEFSKSLEKMGAEVTYMNSGQMDDLVMRSTQLYGKYKDLLEKYIGR